MVRAKNDLLIMFCPCGTPQKAGLSQAAKAYCMDHHQLVIDLAGPLDYLTPQSDSDIEGFNDPSNDQNHELIGPDDFRVITKTGQHKERLAVLYADNEYKRPVTDPDHCGYDNCYDKRRTVQRKYSITYAA